MSKFLNQKIKIFGKIALSITLGVGALWLISKIKISTRRNEIGILLTKVPDLDHNGFNDKNDLPLLFDASVKEIENADGLIRDGSRTTKVYIYGPESHSLPVDFVNNAFLREIQEIGINVDNIISIDRTSDSNVRIIVKELEASKTYLLRSNDCLLSEWEVVK